MSEGPVVRVDRLRAAPADEALAGIHASLVVSTQSVVRSVVAAILACASLTLTLASMVGASGLTLEPRATDLGTDLHSSSANISPTH